ncbi:hypothetical protein [Nonomuraea sediminis]|uniref:hypothetical protein n=1 Tax=Nonomuraea sediminis TaxID=2835864 RepID=UPI001BDCB8EC|nr:hypothetical protein [Nonomuraea sediminis]
MRTSEQNRRSDLIAGIRVLADFLELHPTLPVPYSVDVMAFPEPDGSYAAQRAEIDRAAEALQAELRDHDGHYTARVDFGPVSYRLIAISNEASARYDALMSYRGSIVPEAPTDAGTEGSKSLDIPSADAYGDQCACGALADKGVRQCRKCRSRGRWNRRKAPFYAEGEQR